MAKIARCPSCGAPVEFKSAASILAVCDFCQSTLVRQGEELENLGKMAELIEDRSPLQRGAEGRWNGLHFGLIGRLQLQYEQGLWNEWHLLFDDGKSGWLSEAGGEYVLSQPLWIADALPAFADLKLGQRHLINGRMFAVTNILTAECVAGEGELPFKVGAGYPAPVVDLRDEQGSFATFDYSDDAAQPLVFVGASVDFQSLGWANLREGVPLPQISVKVRAFNCPSCAAPLKISHDSIASVGCGTCGAVLDTRNETVAVLAAATLQRDKVKPLLPLGSTGTLRGEALEVVGFMRRHMTADGVQYPWNEYVLLGEDGRLRWLTEYLGHWNVARVLPRAVMTVVGKVRYDNRDFKQFQSYAAEVDFVIGEFPWRVKLDERAQVDDYVAPPSMLSRETTDNEETWTLAEYLDAAEIESAFQLKAALPKPIGVYANQPNPYDERHKRTCGYFWRLFLAGLVIHLVLLLFGSGGKIIEQPFNFDANDDEPRLSQEFKLTAARSNLEIEQDTSLENNWIGLGLTLVNQDSGEAWQVARELGYYHGVEDGESWSEGSRSAAIVFRDLPPGNYVLAVDGELDANSPPVQGQLKVSHTGPHWSSLFLLLLVLAPFPIYTRIRRGGFEVSRWAESDHPIVTSGSDDDD